MVFIAFNPPRFESASVLKKWMVCRVAMVGKDIAVDQLVDRSWLVILQYKSMASFSCCFSTDSPSVCAT